jgi:general secretion pathway protein I
VSRARGFTLIEVLVALAIAAIGLAAVLSVVGNSARNASYLRDKIFASWIASNHIAELRLGGVMPSVDKTNGDVQFANQKWSWEQTVTQTDVPNMRRVDVAVRLADAPEGSSLATVTGFIGATQLAAPASGTPWDLAIAGAATAPGVTTPIPPPATTTTTIGNATTTATDSTPTDNGGTPP